MTATTPGFRRILFPTDFAETAYDALPYAQRLAQLDGGNIHLLHVVQDFPSFPDTQVYFHAGAFQLEEFLAAARDRLEAARERFGGLWNPVELVVRVGDPASEIDRYAREMEADLIVMATSQPGFLTRILDGSVTESTLRDSPCPVLAVPAARSA